MFDKDFGYIQQFIDYLQQIINMILSLFGKLNKEDATK